jgi:hypothetical protein
VEVLEFFKRHGENGGFYVGWKAGEKAVVEKRWWKSGVYWVQPPKPVGISP